MIVVQEAVGDRAELTHRVSLADIDAKYGDVVSVSEVLEYLRHLSTAV
jgi:isochorismate hydrolase